MVPEQKALIVNADDFGWSTGVNRGIVEACGKGILTSATAMVNFPAFKDAAKMATDLPELGVGLHLNIVHGPPISNPSAIPTLVNASGDFPGTEVVLRRLMLGRVSESDIELELSNQLELFRSEIGEPTHLDSHKHLHVFGSFLPAFIKIAGNLRIPRARCPSENIALRPPSPAWIKSLILSFLGSRAKSVFHNKGVLTPDHFEGGTDGHRFTADVCRRIVDRLEDGVTELMCHPGYRSKNDHDVIPDVAVTKYRERHLRTLLDPSLKAYILERGINLIHFGKLEHNNQIDTSGQNSGY